MIDYRIVIGFAAFAFVISLLSGLIGGVSFGILVLRTFLGTALFAGLGAGVSWVFGRYLSEVFRAGEPRAEPEEEGETGEDVDIVLPEENPHEPEVDELSGLDTDEQEAAEAEEAAEVLEAEEAEHVESLAGEDTPSDLEEVENLDEGEDRVAEVVSPDELEDASGEEEAQSLGGDFADIDSMPALDGLEEDESPDEEPSARPEAASKAGRNVDVMGSVHDPAEAARAIKTWLKKDEKG